MTREGKDKNGTMMAYVWMDRDRRYFISTASTLEPTQLYIQERWRQQEHAGMLEEGEDGNGVNNEEEVKQSLLYLWQNAQKYYMTSVEQLISTIDTGRIY